MSLAVTTLTIGYENLEPAARSELSKKQYGVGYELTEVGLSTRRKVLVV